jgi:hypothetical protein
MAPVESDLGPDETPVPRQESFGPHFAAEVPEGPFQSINAGAFLSADRRVLTIGFIGGRPYTPEDWCAEDYTAWASIRGNALLLAVTTVDHPEQVPMPPNGACTMEGYDYVLTILLPAPFIGDTVRDLGSGELWIPPPDRVPDTSTLPLGLILGGMRVAPPAETDPDPPELIREFFIRPPVAGGPNPQFYLVQLFGGEPPARRGEVLATLDVHGQAANIYDDGGIGMVVSWNENGDGFTLAAWETDLTAEGLAAIASAISVPASN